VSPLHVISITAITQLPPLDSPWGKGPNINWELSRGVDGADSGAERTAIEPREMPER